MGSPPAAEVASTSSIVFSVLFVGLEMFRQAPVDVSFCTVA